MIDQSIFVPGLRVVIEAPYLYRTKFTSILRGFKFQQYLIVDYPTQNGLAVRFEEETQCIVRFIHEGNIYGFETRVLAAIKLPYPLVFLEYPESVESSRLRKAARYPVHIETVVSARKLEGEVEGHPQAVMLNISEGGTLVETKEPFDPETVLYLSFSFPGQGPVSDLETEVKSCQKKGDKFWLGLAFVNRLGGGYEEVKKFLEQLRALRIRV